MIIVYKTTNTINDRYYIGVHKTDKEIDNYFGSGLALKRAIKHYGKWAFKRETLFNYTDEDEHLAYVKEQELLSVHLKDPLCYNLMERGHGSFSKINSERFKYTNPMKDPEIVNRNLESRRLNETEESRQYKKNVCRNNIQKAIEYNTGRKRPVHSQFMSIESKKRWANNKEKIRDCLSTTFNIISPQGEMFTTNRLEEFCLEKSLTYVSVWNSSRTGVPVTKGKSKGWLCQSITHN